MTEVTPYDVEIALKELGETAQDIHNSLIKQGIKGYIGLKRYCPISNYLTMKFKGEMFLIDTSSILWGDTREEIIDMPEGVCEFVSKFDDGRYPNITNPYPF